MAMTREQIRRDALQKSRAATLEKRKKQPPTKAEICAWLRPVRRAISGILSSGEIDSIRGYAVTRIGNDDDYSRVDWCINGFAAVLKRIDPELCLDALERLAKLLEAGVVLTEENLNFALEELANAEASMMRKTLGEIYDAAVIEQIAIEMEIAK